MKHHVQKQLGEESVFFKLYFHISLSSKEAEAGTEAETVAETVEEH